MAPAVPAPTPMNAGAIAIFMLPIPGILLVNMLLTLVTCPIEDNCPLL
jgi:hypothetical protein